LISCAHGWVCWPPAAAVVSVPTILSGVPKAAFFVGNKDPDLALRPEGVPARIADQDCFRVRLLWNVLPVDILIGVNSEIAAVLCVNVRAAVFVTHKGFFLPSPPRPSGLLVRFRLAENFVKRDAGNFGYNVANFKLLFHGGILPFS